MTQLQRIKQAVTEARQAAKAIAVDNCGRAGFFVSRGAHLMGIDAKGDIVYGEGDSHDCGSFTAEELLYALALLRDRPEIDHVSVQGGWNYSASMRDWIDGNYDPLVSEWVVNIYRDGRIEQESA